MASVLLLDAIFAGLTACRAGGILLLMKRVKTIFSRLLCLLSLLLLLGSVFYSCAGKPRPRDAVMNLFTALHNDDSTVIAEIIDFERAWVSVKNDLRQPGDSALAEIPGADRLYHAFIDQGILRQRWTKMQVVINKEQLLGDSATVEVSFVDRETGMHYYNKMGLNFRENRWIIVALRTL